jgi:hypothetical protein
MVEAGGHELMAYNIQVIRSTSVYVKRLTFWLVSDRYLGLRARGPWRMTDVSPVLATDPQRNSYPLRRKTNWMAPPWISTLASVGMAIGPPLVYVDQTMSIIKKKYVPLTCSTEFRSSPLFRDSTGFSRDVCAVLCASHTLFFVLNNRLVDQAARQYYSMLFLAWRAL